MNLILSGSDPLSAKHLNRIRAYEESRRTHGIEILSGTFLTGRIVLFVMRAGGNTSAWAYFPITGCEEFIGVIASDENIRNFTNRCIENALTRFAWNHPDAQEVVRHLRAARGGREE